MYQTVRKISTSKFVTPTNLGEIPVIQKLSAPATDLSLNDIANTASLLAGLKDLNGADPDQVKSSTQQVTQRMGEILNT